jgi:hypothetical protein
MKESAMINTFRYIVDGEQTCAENFVTGDFCEFLRTRRFGTHDTCLFDPNADELERHPGLGFTIPWTGCPLKEKK